ncbi:MAG: FAD-dependent oxidoreductase [Candidatus Nanopelagicales bacterium]|nr:FAD-dependent oxidoreductase [Candidatus Nanopelagicales bacterium]
MHRRAFLGLAAAAGVGAVAGLPAPAGAVQAPARRIPRPTASLVTRWDTDPWALGSYSALPTGTSPRAREVLAEAVIGGRIVLAGEYASPDFPATTQGAYLSGQEAARLLLDEASPRTAIVVGAGLAGASAASLLRAQGVSVTVVEARDRIGGRISSDDRWGVPVELGAAWIHGVTGNPVTALARADGLRLVPSDYDNSVVRDSMTGRVSAAAEQRAEQLDGLMARMGQTAAPLSQSAASWLAARGWRNDRLGAWASASSITQEYGLDPSRLGARALSEGEDYPGGDAFVGGGYSKVPRALLDGIEVRLSTSVQSIAANGTGVRVTTASGVVLQADGVVVAVPLAVLRSGRPSIAGVPAAVSTAAQSLATGNLEKVVLRYSEQWWGTQRVYGLVGGGVPGARAGTPAALRWTEFYSLTDLLGFPALVGFSGGAAARLRPASDAACTAEAVAMLDAAFAH